MSAIPNEAIDAEIVDDELKAPVLQDIQYPVNPEYIDLLINEYKDVPSIDLDANVYEIGEQYQVVLAGHKKFVKARIQIEKVRKTLKAPAIEYGKKVDAIAKEFQAKLKPIEDKLSFERKKVEENEARMQREAEEAEERRVEAITSKIASMERVPLEMMQKTSLELREFLASFDVPTQKEYEEFYDKALILHSQIQTQLSQMANDKELVENAQKLQAEKEAEQERIEAERQAKMQAEREAFEREKAEFEAQKAQMQAEKDALREEQERKEAERLADELQAKQEQERKEAFERNEKLKTQYYNEACEDLKNNGWDNPSMIVDVIQAWKIRHIKWVPDEN